MFHVSLPNDDDDDVLIFDVIVIKRCNLFIRLGYVRVELFDSAKFWDEIRKRSDGKRRILVSEYKAPSDFTIVMKMQSRMGLRSKDDGNKLKNELREERLFEYNPPRGRAMAAFGTLF